MSSKSVDVKQTQKLEWYVPSQAVTPERGTSAPAPFQSSWPSNKSHEVSQPPFWPIPCVWNHSNPKLPELVLIFSISFCVVNGTACSPAFFISIVWLFCSFLSSSGEQANLGFELGEGSMRTLSTSSNPRPSSWPNPLQRFFGALFTYLQSLGLWIL